MGRGLGHRPGEGLAGRFRAVDADDDATGASPSPRRWHDDEGDRGQVEARAADRSQEQAGEAAPPPGADDEQLRIRGGFEEGGGGVLLHEPAGDARVGIGVVDRGQRVGEQPGARRPMSIRFGVEVGRVDRHGLAPRVHHVHVEMTGVCVVHGPLERMLAPRRAVDADDDVTSFTAIFHGAIVCASPAPGRAQGPPDPARQERTAEVVRGGGTFGSGTHQADRRTLGVMPEASHREEP